MTSPMSRLWMAIDGLRRRQGCPKRKQPATPAMLLWIRKSLNPRASQGDAMIWAAILLAYFFLLRASEYTAADQSGVDTGKGSAAWTSRPS